GSRGDGLPPSKSSNSLWTWPPTEEFHPRFSAKPALPLPAGPSLSVSAPNLPLRRSQQESVPNRWMQAPQDRGLHSPHSGNQSFVRSADALPAMLTAG